MKGMNVSRQPQWRTLGNADLAVEDALKEHEEGQEHVDQLCLSDPEWPVQSSGAPGTSSPGSECGCLPGTEELQPTPESDPVL
ncbi:hypothetical protein BaRGS_00009695 [Batillaria attramentaria]|uniref:Uncharacterized protein n=1 Tax=Batillaria attramentaria TaxID=370345 RepID=A0ABD0LIA7_9CAEN